MELYIYTSLKTFGSCGIQTSSDRANHALHWASTKEDHKVTENHPIQLNLS